MDELIMELLQSPQRLWLRCGRGVTEGAPLRRGPNQTVNSRLSIARRALPSLRWIEFGGRTATVTLRPSVA